ncbi:MAG TPA: hypothetical protein VHE56_02435 [Mycobacteriales bacterium]|nr:hypothetical protein [Mycobacteriales bacterium]
MRRKTFDALLTTGGLVVAVVLAVAGGLLAWGHNFAENNVHDQLAAQQIFFPDKAGIAAEKSAEITKYVTPYAGQQVTTGQQAEVFANHYIKVHLAGVADGKTYSQVSHEWLSMKPTDPNYDTVTQQRATLFQGETLRGLLLNAYGFGKMGQIAGVASDAAFISAGLMLLLVIGGMVHAARTSPDREVLAFLNEKAPVPVE